MGQSQEERETHTHKNVMDANIGDTFMESNLVLFLRFEMDWNLKRITVQLTMTVLASKDAPKRVT